MVSYRWLKIRRFYYRHRMGMLAGATVFFLCMALAAEPAIRFAGAAAREAAPVAMADARGKCRTKTQELRERAKEFMAKIKK